MRNLLRKFEFVNTSPLATILALERKHLVNTRKLVGTITDHPKSKRKANWPTLRTTSTNAKLLNLGRLGFRNAAGRLRGR